MLVQIILSIFLVFAVSRVLLQMRERRLRLKSFIFWSGVFIAAILGVLKPGITTSIARFFGIGRGADVVLYFSIVVLFYLIFRLTIAIEEIRGEITKIVRELALSEATSSSTLTDRPNRVASIPRSKKTNNSLKG